jgi:mycofactocin precursor
VRVPEAAVHNLCAAEPGEYPAKPGEGVAEDDFGTEMSDEELGELLVREITIDGMCGVY